MLAGIMRGPCGRGYFTIDTAAFTMPMIWRYSSGSRSRSRLSCLRSSTSSTSFLQFDVFPV